MRTNWKIVPDRKSLSEVVQYERVLGSKIAFTNGCFDIFHAGHVKYLEAASSYANILIVGLNSDESIKRIKGEKRPIVSVEERALVLAGLACVNYICVFEEDTPYSMIMQIKPDVLIKGGDWDIKNIVGFDIVKGNGGSIHIVDFEIQQSTTHIINKIIDVYKE